MKQNDVTNVFGYSISNGGITEAVTLASQALLGRSRPLFVACANPHSLIVASRDAEFRNALQSADILLPDGYGIVLAARLLAQPLTTRVSGNDFFVNFSRKIANKHRLSYFFLGSSNHVLDLISVRLAREYPSIKLCGLYSPPFKDSFIEEENLRMIEAIRVAKPDVLWVGMTAPKQEKWIYQNRDRLNVPLISAIGAVFDFYAGTTKQAPLFLQKAGLEWLVRSVKEPGRLGKRNLFSIPVFLVWIIKERLKRMR